MIQSYCCGYPTHLRSVRYEIRSLPEADQLRWRTANRWCFYAKWQCHVRPDHNGEGPRYSTDDPDEVAPYRDGRDIEPFAARRYDAGSWWSQEPPWAATRPGSPDPV